MTSTKSFILLLLALIGMGYAIIYETIKSVEYVESQVLKVNSIYKSKN